MLRLCRVGGVILVVLGFGTFFLVRQFGGASLSWKGFALGDVEFDDQGIPTLVATDWERLTELQGYVTASDRLWQMELMRRSASGGLSEWFGNLPQAVEHDLQRKREGWEGFADQAVALLPGDQKRYCESYANGVNRFLTDHPHRVGIEYTLLRTSPERWQCRDTVLILMLMAEDLTGALEKDVTRTRWNRHLDQDWQAFLFPNDHPWNVPIFGVNQSKLPSIPTAKAIPLKPLSEQERTAAITMEEGADTDLGSNNWLWRGGGKYFLANDPHLGYTVPGLWYEIRLRVSNKDWVVGASLPGLPGVILGRNRYVAWGFTNLDEDVDDLIEETLSTDGKKYLASSVGQSPYWLPVEERSFTLKIKGAPDQIGVSRFTRRGPLQQYIDGDLKYYSRQWLGLKPEFLRMPSIGLNRVLDWKSFNTVIDQMAIPAQNIIFMDNIGNMGYRASGTGVKRRVSGMWVQPAGVGDWEGFEASSSRPRLYLPIDQSDPKGQAHLQTANQKIYTGGFPQYWSSSQREERIRTVLSDPKALVREDMEKLQRDTFSRFHKQLLLWIGSHASAKNDFQKTMTQRWQRWDGFITSDSVTFAEALYAGDLFRNRLLNRVRTQFFPEEEREIPYRHGLENTWMLSVLEQEHGARAFGVEDSDLAQSLLDSLESNHDPLKIGSQNLNRWGAQHPLSMVPVIGRLFQVKEYPQWGAKETVRVERPKFGAGVRLVWDMGEPLNSTWITPVGQSGHVLTAHYRDSQEPWFAGKPYKVFPKNYDWGFETPSN